MIREELIKVLEKKIKEIRTLNKEFNEIKSYKLEVDEKGEHISAIEYK